MENKLINEIKKEQMLIQYYDLPFFVGNRDKQNPDANILDICNIEMDFTNDKPYFKLTLRFPDGSFRAFYISTNALIPRNKAP